MDIPQILALKPGNLLYREGRFFVVAEEGFEHDDWYQMPAVRSLKYYNHLSASSLWIHFIWDTAVRVA